MFALETVLKVAFVGACSAVVTAIVTGAFGLRSSRKPDDRKPSDNELPREVLNGTIRWQNKKIAELRTEVRHLKSEVRRLEHDQQRGDP